VNGVESVTALPRSARCAWDWAVGRGGWIVPGLCTGVEPGALGPGERERLACGGVGFELAGIGSGALDSESNEPRYVRNKIERGKFVLARPRVRGMRLSVVGSSGPGRTNVER
jgi:hypothetical protein